MVTKTSVLKEQGFFIRSPKNKPSNFAFKGGLFHNRYNRKRYLKILPYKRFWNIFKNHAKPLFIRVTVFWVNLFLYNKYSNIYKKYSFFIVFVEKKEGILEYN